MAEKAPANDFAVLSGRLLYRVASTGRVRGREDWQLTYNRDGHRTLRCLARTDDSRFVRDAVYTITPEGRPLEAYVRLQVAEKWIGSGHFFAHDGRLHLQAWTAESGPESHIIPVPERFHILTHAVMLDGWTFWAYDEAAGGAQELPTYNTSTRWDGTDGPVGRLETLRAERQGSEWVTVPAGRFEATRFGLLSTAISSPPCQLWVTGEHKILVRYAWPEWDLEYVLESFAESADDAAPLPSPSRGDSP